MVALKTITQQFFSYISSFFALKSGGFLFVYAGKYSSYKDQHRPEKSISRSHVQKNQTNWIGQDNECVSIVLVRGVLKCSG